MAQVAVDNWQGDLPVREEQIAPLVEAVLALERARADEVSVLLADAEQMSAIHAEHFDDASLTDCMSFPMDEEGSEYRVLGDVVVCPRVAVDYAAAHGGDPFEELSLYLVHGILHLLGYNDLQESERSAMRAAEARHMENLRSKELLLSSSL